VRIEIGGGQSLEIKNLLLDFNGTLAQGSRISEHAKALLQQLSINFNICVATADTRGNAAAECEGLPVKLLELPRGMPEDKAKLQLLEKLGRENTITLGNGRNDALMLARAALGVCVLGEEGAHKAAVAAAQVLVSSIEDGLKLLGEPERLLATLRN
jgi:soluble P-type ATPase